MFSLKDQLLSPLKNLLDSISKIGKKKVFLVLSILTVLSIPLTVWIVQQKQNTTQFASGADPITFVDNTGNPISQTVSTTVSLQLNAPWPVQSSQSLIHSKNGQGNVAGTATFMVYDEALASGWSTGPAGAKYNMNNTSPVYSGRYSISYSQGNKPFILYAPSNGFLTAPYNTIQFYARSSSFNQSANITLYGIKNKPLSTAVTIDSYALSPTAWTLFTIPLSAFGATSQQLSNITFQTTQTLYLDQIQFVYLSTPTPTVVIPTSIPTTAPEAASIPTSAPTPTVVQTVVSNPTSTPVPTTVPTATNTPTAIPTPTPIVYTVSAQVSDDPTFATNTLTINPYDKNPYPLNFTFSDNSAGTKTLYVKFVSSTGTVQSYTNTIQLIPPTPTPTPSSQSTPTPLAIGWVHTNGTTIVDGSGNPTHLAGVDEGGHLVQGQGNNSPHSCPTWSAATSATIASMHQMGFNTNRIGVSWANIEPTAPTVNPDGTMTHHWDTQYLAAIDSQVNYLQQNGMMAILDMHQAGWSPYFTTDPKLCQGTGMPSWLYTTVPNTTNGLNTARCEFFSDVAENGSPEKPQEGLAAAWAMLAARYSSNSTVIGADMVNEPWFAASCTGADLPAFYEKIGASIRSTNPNIILMYEDDAYDSYMNSGTRLPRKPNLTNAMFSWHFYPPDWTTGEPPLAAHLSKAQSWNVPLWIGESDAMTETRNPGTDANWQTDLTNQMTYFKDNDINWTLWAYDTGCCSVVVHNTTTPKQPLLSILQQYE